MDTSGVTRYSRNVITKRIGRSGARRISVPGVRWGMCVLAGWMGCIALAGERADLNRSFKDPNLDATQWIERFEREGREVYDERERIVAAAGLKPGMVVADVGAGTGLFEPLFAKAVGPEGRVLAVDIAPRFVELIRRRAEANGWTNVEARLCDETSVGLPPASVDFVFVCDTYHHFTHPAQTLASIYQALKPGGVLMIVEFRREPGVSSDWVLNHVRAGESTFRREIEAAGFQFFERHDFLKQNYILKFRKPIPKTRKAPRGS